MNTFEYILVGIGVISIVWWIYKFFKSLLNFFGNALEAAFRNQLPYDYLRSLSFVTRFFEEHGFKREELIHPGSDKPGIRMKKEDDEIVEIYLTAPLEGKYEIEVIFKKQSLKVGITEMSEESKTVLIKTLKHIWMRYYSNLPLTYSY